MATTLSFKRIIDIPQWRPHAPTIGASAAGSSLAFDLRNDDTNHPYIYMLRSATAFDIYDPTTDEWLPLASPALAGTFGAGASSICHPTAGPRGTLTTGNTTTKIVLSTALPAAVAINQLANRGDGTGHRILIVGNAAGSSGKMEVRKIVANTAGTTPTIWLDSALTFTPASGDAYELRSGRVFLLSAGTLAAGVWKYFDIATTSYSGNLATTNLPATIGGDSSLVAMSEAHVPNTRKPGEGFVSGSGTYDSGAYGCIAATATGATSITGSGMPSDLAADEYRNFQIRIVEDTTTPTAVGQRRRISTHTSGATGAFTVAAWAVTPSATAKFVVENDDDKILLFTNQTGVYNYNITANTWDTTTWAAAANAGAAGIVCEQAFGITRDTTNYARHSYIYRIRGGNVNAIDVFDISAAATGSWSADIAYKNKGLTTFNTGTSGAYDPATFEGRFLHLCVSGTQRSVRFDLRNRTLDPGTYIRYPQGTAVVGAKMAWTPFTDGATKLGFVYMLMSTSSYMFSMAIQS